jgi:hypothetical protein
MKNTPSTYLLLAGLLAVRLSAQVDVVSGGNVGIGTSSPAGKLHVKVGSNLDVVTYAPASASGISDFATGGVGWSFARPSDGALAHAIYTYNTAAGTKNNLAISARSDIVFTAGNSGPAAAPERLRITENGNVGIGTTSPGYKLHVAGSNPQIVVQSTSGTADLWGIHSDNTTQRWSLVNNTSGYGEVMTVLRNGNVGIGATSPSYKLQVTGSVRAGSFISDTTTYADFVFKPGYELPALSDVEEHIKAHGHLPGIPSEAEARAEGIDLAAMQVKLLQKIEELTLHQIAQDKRLRALEAENISLKSGR